MTQFGSLVELLGERAASQGDSRAFVALGDRGRETGTLTFAALDQKARGVAARLRATAGPGERALLFYETGVEFLIGYFGCQYARMIPVPVVPPRPGKPLRPSTLAIAHDCRPKFGIAPREMVTQVSGEFAAAQISLEWLTVDEELDGQTCEPLPSGVDDIAHMQYTSGSTSTPRGVVITHGNVLHNVEMIRRIHDNTAKSTHVCWLPLYHDMGLVLNVLESLYIGALCVLIPPIQFIFQPLLWVRAFHDYRGRVGGGPNFGFDLCSARATPQNMEGLDLSSWEVAINGAEPVRAETIARFVEVFGPRGFRRSSMNPCYGMAETTLLISGGPPGRDPIIEQVSQAALQRHRVAPGLDGDRQAVVGCGVPLAWEKVAIVDPASLRRCAPDEVGEIWVAGPHVGNGYWERSEATEATFRAHIADDGDGPYLRTGDLGFLKEGEIFVTGRLKDVLIVRGHNHYPQDIEHTSERSHPALRRSFSAAFTIPLDTGASVVVVQEVDREHEPTLDIPQVTGAIRAAIVATHGLALGTVILVKHGTIPKTSSGKIQRAEARRQCLAQELAVVGRSDLNASDEDKRATS